MSARAAEAAAEFQTKRRRVSIAGPVYRGWEEAQVGAFRLVGLLGAR